MTRCRSRYAREKAGKKADILSGHEAGRRTAPFVGVGDVARLTLPPRTDSVPAARRFVREQLRDSEADLDTALLLVSEVVTNALLHARSEVVLTVEDRRDTARVEVADASPVQPKLRHVSLEAGTGRGLQLLDRLALRWGILPGPGRGKIVWFEVGAPDEAMWESVAVDLLEAPDEGRR